MTAHDIHTYLTTGDHDPHRYGLTAEGLRRATDELIEGLVAEVRRRAAGKRSPAVPKGFDRTSFARRKLEPMVRGLFPRKEQKIVLGMLERSVVFVTRKSIERVLRRSQWLATARDLANLYLGAVGAELLSEDSPRLVGLSEHTTCYVSALYFREEDPFADFVVHEAAHVFHNCKRRTIGLPHTRRREWLLDIDFRKRETFAYSCEAYARVLERSKTPTERRALADRFATDPWTIEGPEGATSEVAQLVVEASRARNGWKVILRGCAPEPRPRRTV